MVMFTLSVFEQKYPFYGNFVSKNNQLKNCSSRKIRKNYWWVNAQTLLNKC